MSEYIEDDDNDFLCMTPDEPKRTVDESESFGQYKVRMYFESNDNYHVTLEYASTTLVHLEFEHAEEAGNEFRLIRGIVKHAAHQIECASATQGFGSAGSAPQML